MLRGEMRWPNIVIYKRPYVNLDIIIETIVNLNVSDRDIIISSFEYDMCQKYP